MQAKPDRRMTVHTSKPTAFIATRAPESCVRVEAVVLLYQSLSTVIVLVHAVSVCVKRHRTPTHRPAVQQKEPGRPYYLT